jgi:hypothetical protein
MLLIIAASIVTAAPTSSAVQAQAFIRIERPALASADEWKHASTEAKRRERVIKDERGQLQMQRVFEYE